MNIKKHIPVFLGFIILIAAGFILTASIGKGKSHETALPERGSIAGSIKESGNIEGEKEYTCFAEVSAPVKEADIEVGDLVSAGKLLLSYDTETLERTVSEAAISVSQSDLNVKGQLDKSDKYSAKYNKAAADDSAYAMLYAWQRESADSQDEAQYAENWGIQCEADSIQKNIASKQQEIASKETEYAGLSDQDKAGERGRSLQQDMADLEKNIADMQKGLASLPPARMNPEEYARYNDTSNVMEDITRNWNEAKTQKGEYEAAILNDNQKEALKKQTEIAISRQEAAESELNKALKGVRADFDGVVTECSVKAGNVVTKGTPLFKLVNTEDLKVTVMISKFDIGRVRIGQRADISFSGMTYEGEVSRINHVATPDDSDKNKVAVEVRILKPDENLILGLETDVRIYTDEKENVLIIPYEAFYSDDGGDYCYVIENGVIAKKYVTAGIRTDEKVEIIDGLTENDELITDSVTDSQVGEKAVGSLH